MKITLIVLLNILLLITLIKYSSLVETVANCECCPFANPKLIEEVVE